MLLKRRLPHIDTTRPIEVSPGFEHLNRNTLAVLRWLKEHRVEFVLVGPVANAVHSRTGSALPVAIVPAPFARNLERLARALNAAEARVRDEREALDPHPSATGRITAQQLTRPDVWTLWCGPHPIDVVGTSAPSSSGASAASAYQELLYEASGFELGPELSVQVAAPEDIQHYAHLHKTGRPPRITVSRRSPVRRHRSDRAPTAAPGPGSPLGSG
jgi:hypothetical protein